ncbi:MAG: TerD family protein [Cyanothece sp. SIO1E1]|nr:TerD family protein [Cyanothece sp. SIO1E1]
MRSSSGPKLPLKASTQLKCGLGWDAAVDNDFDLDIAALCLDSTGKLPRGITDLVYVGAPKHDSGAIALLNDNLTGEGEGDDERMIIDLPSVPQSITGIIFAVTIDCGREQQQDFSQVQNAFWRLVDSSTGKTLIHQSLSNSDLAGKTALLTAALERAQADWCLMPLREAMTLNNMNELLNQYL